MFSFETKFKLHFPEYPPPSMLQLQVYMEKWRPLQRGFSGDTILWPLVQQVRFKWRKEGSKGLPIKDPGDCLDLIVHTVGHHDGNAGPRLRIGLWNKTGYFPFSGWKNWHSSRVHSKLNGRKLGVATQVSNGWPKGYPVEEDFEHVCSTSKLNTLLTAVCWSLSRQSF